ncbi:MAG: type II toxin-antitoxin system HicA family toxin [Candidatus Poribacteria bacterium]
MRRIDFIRELEDSGCQLERRGSRHDIYINTRNGRKAPVPRHSEIKPTLCNLIRKQLKLKNN